MTRIPALGAKLTPCELTVIRLLAEGLTQAAVARQLNISHATVKTHAGNICRALGASTITNAVAILARQDRLDPTVALLADITRACAAAADAGVPELLILKAALGPTAITREDAR